MSVVNRLCQSHSVDNNCGDDSSTLLTHWIGQTTDGQTSATNAYLTIKADQQ